MYFSGSLICDGVEGPIKVLKMYASLCQCSLWNCVSKEMLMGINSLIFCKLKIFAAQHWPFNRILRPQGSEMFLFHAFSNMSTSRTPYDYIIFGKFNLDAKHLKNQKLILQRHKNKSDKHLMITFQVASSTWTTNMLRLDPTFNSDLPESKRWLKEFGARENEAFRF